ncbi:amidohydrolase 2 [Dentipellis sp. KUC8613]|nr:amidohydrolase 2 [Dentipellis sp. KUC8613]
MSSTTTSPTRLIDVHHHIFPSMYPKAALARSVGFRTPPAHLPWSPEISLRAMDALGVELAILSAPAGFPHGTIGDPHEITKSVNGVLRDICVQHAGRFAFWGCLGDWTDVKGALELIPYVLDELKAVGIAISSSYGEGADAKYIGDDMFDPIWEELNRRNAVIFLHGSQTPSSTPYPHETLGLPISEVPNETYKALFHLIVTGKTRRWPNIALLLAHLGGSAAFLAPRVAALSHYMGSELSEDEILEEFKKCWWDAALSSGKGTLSALEAWGVSERIVWGSDFPAVPQDTVKWFENQLQDFYQTDEPKLRSIHRYNVQRLFESHGVDIFPSSR